MTKRALALLLACVLAAVFGGCFPLGGSRFTALERPIYIKSREERSAAFTYYEVGANGISRECAAFEPNVNEYYDLNVQIGFFNQSDTAVTDYLGRPENDHCTNEKRQEMKIPALVRKALCALDRCEPCRQHAYWVERAFVHNGVCFLSVAYNVNLCTPYHLFWYVEQEDALTEVFSVVDHEILGLKI